MKDVRLYPGHTREAIADIRTYAAVGEPLFLEDRMRQDAIIRKLEVIGEAVKQLSEPKHPTVVCANPETKRLVPTSVQRVR